MRAIPLFSQIIKMDSTLGHAKLRSSLSDTIVINHFAVDGKQTNYYKTLSFE